MEDAKAGVNYGNAFIHPDFVRGGRAPHLDTEALHPAGLRGWQDDVVFRR